MLAQQLQPYSPNLVQLATAKFRCFDQNTSLASHIQPIQPSQSQLHQASPSPETTAYFVLCRAEKKNQLTTSNTFCPRKQTPFLAFLVKAKRALAITGNFKIF